jgi:Tol biopolymer transport system component
MKKKGLPVLVGLILLINLACGFPSLFRISATKGAPTPESSATQTQVELAKATATLKAVSPSSTPVKPATATTRPQATATTRPQATATTQHSGGQIVFLSCKNPAYLSKGTKCGIHIITADGCNIRQLTDNDSDGGGSLSPDGTRVMFSRKDQEYEIYVIHTDGSGLKRLPNGPEGSAAGGWSPDGSQIIYISSSKSSSCPIYVMDADGNNPHPLMNSSDCDGYGLRWSPDGSQIVFLTHITNTSSTLHIMNADGSHAQVIKTSPALVIERLRWSPDGTKIAFLNQKTFDDPIEVDVINKDGTNQHSLTAGFYPVFGGLSWSPDGQQLIFNMNGDGKSLDGLGRIWVVNADGSNVHRLKVGCPGYSCFNAEWGH